MAGSLRRLDDGQLDRLLRAMLDEARQRGRPLRFSQSGRAVWAQRAERHVEVMGATIHAAIVALL